MDIVSVSTHSFSTQFVGVNSPKSSILVLYTLASILVGNEVKDTEWSRFTLRPMFDAGLVTSFHAQEDVLDYVFDNLQITTATVEHPILMTEPLCNPNYCRQREYFIHLIGYINVHEWCPFFPEYIVTFFSQIHVFPSGQE